VTTDAYGGVSLCGPMVFADARTRTINRLAFDGSAPSISSGITC